MLWSKVKQRRGKVVLGWPGMPSLRGQHLSKDLKVKGKSSEYLGEEHFR